MVNIEICKLAEKEHEKSNRQYAHTLHKNNTICISKDLLELPFRYVCGLILHELGHLKLQDREHTEKEADEVGGMLARVKIERVSTDSYGDNLECIKRNSIEKAKKFIERTTNLRFKE